MITTANLATQKHRLNTATDAIKSIYKQVDVVRVFIDFDTPDEWNLFDNIDIVYLNNEPLRSSRKVAYAMNENEYYFVIDDDLIYPSDYVEKYLELLHKYDDKALITIGGKILKEGHKRSYFGDLKHNYHFTNNIKTPTPVHIALNCAACWNTNILKINMGYFDYFHMDDICVSVQANQQNIPRIIIPHKSDWLKYNKPNGKTLHEEFLGNDKTQTKVINKIDWKL